MSLRKLVVQSQTEPPKEKLWLHNGVLKYYSPNGWKPLVGSGNGGGESSQIDWENILNKPNLIDEETFENFKQEVSAGSYWYENKEINHAVIYTEPINHLSLGISNIKCEIDFGDGNIIESEGPVEYTYKGEEKPRIIKIKYLESVKDLDEAVIKIDDYELLEALYRLDVMPTKEGMLLGVFLEIPNEKEPIELNIISDGNPIIIGSSSFGELPYKELKFPDEVIEIRERAFRSTRTVGPLILPKNLEVLGEECFDSAEEFTGDLIIPDNVKIIPSGAFSDCKGLNGELIIPEGVEYIDSYAFTETGFSGKLYIPKTVLSIGTRAFSRCENISEIHVSKDTKLEDNWNFLTDAKIIKY